jgi:stage II sporulation protein Q
MVDEVMEMNDQKKDQLEKKDSNKAAAPLNQKADGAHAGRSATHTSSWKKFTSRKWVFPAAYLAAAAIILGIMFVYQGSNNDMLTEENLDPTLADEQQSDLLTGPEDDMPVTALPEDFAWPTLDMAGIEVVMPYYDDSLSAEEKTMAVIQYENTFVTSDGIALARADNETFDVTAALGGTVTRVENAPVIGNVVEIEHDNGLSTIYYSLADVQVEQGQQVSQGEVIAKAGQNEYEKDLGVHLHFEVHENGEPVNPHRYLPEMD